MQHTSEGACVVAAEGSKIVGGARRLSKGSTLQIVDGPEVFNVLVCNGGSKGLPNGIKEVNWWYTWPKFLILAVPQCLRALKRNPDKRIKARLLCQPGGFQIRVLGSLRPGLQGLLRYLSVDLGESLGVHRIFGCRARGQLIRTTSEKGHHGCRRHIDL